MSRQFKTTDEMKEGFELCLPSRAPADVSANIAYGQETLRSEKAMSDISRQELRDSLVDIESRMDRRIQRMEEDATRRAEDYRRELSLRDDQVRREAATQREITDDRLRRIDDSIKAFMDLQAEREKRYEDLSARAVKAAEGAEEAAKQAATVKSNYWAAVGVQLLAVAAIVVGGYFALHQSNQSVAQTVQSTYQMGRDDGRKEDSKPPVVPVTR